MASADFTDIEPSDKLSRIYAQLNQRTTALRSAESSTSFPATTTPGQRAFRTDIGWVFERNQADDAWIAMWEVDNGPWAPLLFELDAITNPTWIASTVVATTPGGGAEDEGVDMFVNCTLSTVGSGMVIKLPDIAAWAYRKVWITLFAGFGDEVSVQNESDSSVICEISTIGDSVLLQCDSSGTWEPVFTSLQGSRTLTADLDMDAENPSQWWATNFWCKTATGSITIDLPAISKVGARFSFPIVIKKVDATANTVTIIPTAGATSPTIEGAASKVLTDQYDSITIMPDEPNNVWRITSFVGTAAASTALLSVTQKTANYTLTLSDDVVECDSSGGAFTITLPVAATATGQVFYVKRTAPLGAPITVDADSAELIDGALTVVLPSGYISITLCSNGTGWIII